jgi:hypothetical protein
MSVMQLFSVLVQRGLFVLLLLIIAIFALCTTVASGGFAASLVTGFLQTFWVIVIAVAIDLLKMLLPVAIWRTRFRSPRISSAMQVFCAGCAIVSLIFSLGWAMSLPEPSYQVSTVEELNALYSGQSPLTWTVLLFFAQAVTLFGPLFYVVAAESVTEKPEEPEIMPPMGPPIAPQVAGPAGPSPFTDIQSIFGAWVNQVVSRDPNGSVSLAEALASFNAWASSQGYPTASPEAFGPLMTDAAMQNGGFASQGIFMGVSIAPSHNYIAVH